VCPEILRNARTRVVDIHLGPALENPNRDPDTTVTRHRVGGVPCRRRQVGLLGLQRRARADHEERAEDAGLEGGRGLGLTVGSEYGDFRSGAEFFNGFLRRGPAGLSPMIFPNTVMNSMAAVVAIAAKNARLAWAVLKFGEEFRLHPAAA
jgi:hypothetical protein